ncbi:MAG: VanW family protein [Sporichthyaceae bacterium]
MNGLRHPARLAALVVGGALTVVVGLYVLAIVLVGSDVPRGTRVAGVEVGGMSTTAAQAKIASAVPAALPGRLSLVAADRTFEVVPAQSGLSVDAAATAAKARQNGRSPGVALRALFGQTRNVEPIVATDVARLTTVLDEIGALIRQEKVEGGLVFLDGVANAVDPVPGRNLDIAATVPAVSEAWTSRRAQVTGVIAVDAPGVSKEAVEAALAGFGAQAMAAPVTVKVGTTEVEVTAGQLGKHLTTVVENGALKPLLDGEKLSEELMESSPDLGTTARDAKFVFSGGKPKIQPSRAGTTIDPAKLGDAVLAVLTVDGPREVIAEVTQREPKFTTADAEALGIKEKISSFKTQYPFAPYRVTNIGRAAKLINGSLVKPGDTWSLNKRVGQRTAANGFVRGFIIKGSRFVEDLGGGVSQSATTTFNAAFFAGVQDVEHHPHSLYIGRYPAGREATVAWPAKDLRFKNDSGHGVLIQAEHRVGQIEVSFWGTKVWDEIKSISSPKRNIRPWKTIELDDEKCLAQLPAEGFDITVTRVFVRDGKEVKRENFNTSYAATDKIVCTKDDPKASPSPLPTGDPTSTESPSPFPTAKPNEDMPTIVDPGLDPATPAEPSGEGEGAGGGGSSDSVSSAGVRETPSPAPTPERAASTPPRSRATPAAGRRASRRT